MTAARRGAAPIGRTIARAQSTAASLDQGAPAEGNHIAIAAILGALAPTGAILSRDER